MARKRKEKVLEIRAACILILVFAAAAQIACGIDTGYWQGMLSPIVWYLIGANKDRLHA